ncbi:hypothetical protein ASF92_07460 [Pedobacter sp. Leaf176]|nr:hypothetical protein ASF92_07460 [Pedobacter sp. Leaf176]
MLSIWALLFTACSSSDKKEETIAKSDTTLLSETKSRDVDPITGKMMLVGNAKLGQPINIKFSVYNNADTAAKFCKWHTPFEGLMSKYLDVSLDDYTPVDYKGPMAKRVMPPPGDSYTTLKKGDSTSVDFNLNDAYTITKPGAYTIKYNSATISGIIVKDSLKINVSN